jgi:hypothetical protein
MAIKRVFVSLLLNMSAALLAACATQPAAPQVPAAPPTAAAHAAAPAAAIAPTPAAPAANAAATESDTAAAMEKKFRDADRSYKVVQRDGKTLYCKRERVIGTTIPTMQCLTESQLRNQVETMDEMRGRMRSNGKCTLGVGCGAGG